MKGKDSRVKCSIFPAIQGKLVCNVEIVEEALISAGQSSKEVNKTDISSLCLLLLLTNLRLKDVRVELVVMILDNSFTPF